MELVGERSNQLADGLARIQRDVDAAFDEFLPVPGDTRARLVEAMRYAAIDGGKRVRPLLLAATAGMYGVARETAVKCGCAVEAIHVYSLIHDDLPCMDDDDLRHGKPTLHKAFDEATAVLAGDALHALAFEILSMPETVGDPFVRAELVSTLAGASGMGGMAGGQMMDMVAGVQDYDLQAITRLQQLKTGALLAASVEMGAILGRVPPDARAHLRGYSRDVGLAFQIADDLLDHEGDEAKAGKALRKDDEQARDQARALVEQAVGHLAPHGSEADVLRALARFIVERDR